MIEPAWLPRWIIEIIHYDQIQEHGGRLGVRDESVVEAALSRPKNEWAYQRRTDLAVLAAAYGYAFARNHAFVDGDKRVAFMAVYTFLGMNGYDIDAPEPAVVVVVRDLAADRLSEKQFAAWIRGHMRSLEDR